MNWQPIETAPVDRGDVLLWTPSGMLVGYCYVRGKWHPSGVKASDEGCDVELYEAPTHWMPLPVCPECDRQRPTFGRTYCSQCGNAFGPGDSGFSHCEDHLNKEPA